MDRTKYVDEKALAHFDRFHRNHEKEIIPAPKGIDIVLIHPKSKVENNGPKSKKEHEEERKNQVRDKLRKKYENKLRNDGFIVEETAHKDKVYKELHCSFKRLCIEAEKTHLQMPLQGLTYPGEGQTNMCSKFVYNKFETDNSVYPKSTRFKMKRIHLFDNHWNPSKFFRPAVRTLLVNNILINMNLIDDVEIDDIRLLDEDVDGNCLTRKNFNTGAHSTLATDRKFENLSMLNFPYLKKLAVYTDILILHEPSKDSKLYDEQPESTNKETQDVQDDQKPLPRKDCEEDPRKDLNDEWNTFFKFQPLTKIRNYFGEKIAFYFTWSGLLMTSLWVPMIFGLTIFIFGLLKSVINETDTSSAINATDDSSAINATDNSRLTQILAVFTEACDNVITPYYALFICVWGTVFLNLWKRKTAILAYKWAVDGFEVTETDRPEFCGTKKREHPVTGNDDWYYPMRKRLIKFLLSGLILVVILCIVLASVIGILIGKALVLVKYCSNKTDQSCVLGTKFGSFLLNLISILILDKVYDLVARRLTDWENHRTQTSFDDALIVKLFAFRFANNYASCFYIAFVKGRIWKNGIFGLGEQYIDNCEPNGNCMSDLSLHILFLISGKPITRFIFGTVVVWLKRFWRKIHHRSCKRKVGEVREKLTFIQKEARKPQLGEFSLEEHTEKMIQYGFLMLFTAALPIAPLIVLITHFIDKRLDARRMLWWYRRPLATISQDIGMWYILLKFVNICGVISNGFLIGFTSSWGRQCDFYTRLWIVVGFEHIVFAVKFMIDYIIPDVPPVVRLMSTKDMHDITITIKKDKDQSDLINVTTNPQVKDSQPRMIPAVDTKEQALVKKLVHRQRVTKENTDEEVYYIPTRKLKKRKKKKKLHQRQEDQVDDDIEHPPRVKKLYYQSDAQYYTTGDQDRPICFKVKGPRNYLNVKRPRSQTIKEIGDSRHGSKHSDDSKA